MRLIDIFQRRYRYAAQQAAEAQAAGYTHYPQPQPQQQQQQPPAEGSNEFRTRFHRPLTAPSPFGQMVPPPQPAPQAEAADLGHARGEAEGVAEKLGRYCSSFLLFLAYVPGSM